MASEDRTAATTGSRPRLLDLFCGGGGASMGYWLSGFEVVGVDVAKRGRYPFAHFQADAIEFVRAYGQEFDAIHASPPCQAYSRLAARHPEREYPDLVAPTREALQATGKPYVIENVPEAPLMNAYVLCGSSFGLGTREYQLRRHRAFETTFPLMVAPCSHDEREVISVAGHAGRASRNMSGTTVERREAMQIPWLSSDAIAEAIPPDYTYYIGRQLLDHLVRSQGRRTKLSSEPQEARSAAQGRRALPLWAKRIIWHLDGHAGRSIYFWIKVKGLRYKVGVGIAERICRGPHTDHDWQLINRNRCLCDRTRRRLDFIPF